MLFRPVYLRMTRAIEDESSWEPVCLPITEIASVMSPWLHAKSRLNDFPSSTAAENHFTTREEMPSRNLPRISNRAKRTCGLYPSYRAFLCTHVTRTRSFNYIFEVAMYISRRWSSQYSLQEENYLYEWKKNSWSIIVSTKEFLYQKDENTEESETNVTNAL